MVRLKDRASSVEKGLKGVGKGWDSWVGSQDRV